MDLVDTDCKAASAILKGGAARTWYAPTSGRGSGSERATAQEDEPLWGKREAGQTYKSLGVVSYFGPGGRLEGYNVTSKHL